jgi:4'-phosphopantetheinyl transferase
MNYFHIVGTKTFMPVARIESLGENSCWALWKIEEDEADLSYQALETCPEEVISTQKRLEYLAGRALMKHVMELLGKGYVGMRKDEAGKPFLKDSAYQVSLSHSYPYAAAQIHHSTPVGIDLEQPKEKLLRIAGRVLSATEEKDAGDHVTKHCIYWCAKEALYKIHGKRGLHFNSQLLLEPFQMKTKGELFGKIVAGNTSREVALEYLVEDDYVLVTTKP